MAAGTPRDEDRATYYYDQLFTIGVCGALAGVTLMLWRTNQLGKMLDPKFHIWVALGGLTLLALVALRAIAVWLSVDEAADALPTPETHGGHSHGHGEVCN